MKNMRNIVHLSHVKFVFFMNEQNAKHDLELPLQAIEMKYINCDCR